MKDIIFKELLTLLEKENLILNEENTKEKSWTNKIKIKQIIEEFGIVVI